MRKNFWNELFNGITTEDLDVVFEESKKFFNKVMEELNDENSNEEEKKIGDDEDEVEVEIHDYESMSGARYEDGELVHKYDKEYVDGKCVKNEEFNALEGTTTSTATTLDDKSNNDENENTFKCHRNKQYRLRKEGEKKIDELTKLNEAYKEQMNEMVRHIDNLNDEVKSLKDKLATAIGENTRLTNKIDVIKGMFE